MNKCDQKLSIALLQEQDSVCSVCLHICIKVKREKIHLKESNILTNIK